MTQFVEQQLVTNFNTIINSLQGDITAMQATPPFDGCSVTQPIIDALREVSSSPCYDLYIFHLRSLIGYSS